MLHQTVIGLMCLIISTGCSEGTPIVNPQSSITELLQDSSQNGFKKALKPIHFEFPQDHGAHPGFKNEWWYFTGNVETEHKRKFGFQFTLFRTSISPNNPQNPSHWATNQLYLAHLALTDIEAREFRTDERFARGALDLAGVKAEPFNAWLEDWQIVGIKECTQCFHVKLNARTKGFGFTLDVNNTHAPIKHGDSGLSQKSSTPGNASYYYSYPRMQTHGEIHIGDISYNVSGESWFDHEWSTSYLEKDQLGWDWFSLQLSDETELMLFRLRHRDNAEHHFEYGSFVDVNGKVTKLGKTDFSIQPISYWESPETNISYPSAWRINIPKYQTDITVSPMIENQEMNLTFRYWEGSVAAQGTHNNAVVSGRGYVELTGYQ